MQVRRVTKKELEVFVEDKQTEGFKIENRTERQATLVKRDLGSAGWHVIIFLLTFWFTLGLGNLIYLVYRYFLKQEKIIVKIK